MSLPYTLKFSEKSARELEKLPKDINLRIWNKLQEAKLDPFRYFIRLKGRTDYKLRVGDYRITADIKQNDRLIEVNKIGHRKNIYD
jgi:mRNA interferase RelE/StbE